MISISPAELVVVLLVVAVSAAMVLVPFGGIVLGIWLGSGAARRARQRRDEAWRAATSRLGVGPSGGTGSLGGCALRLTTETRAWGEHTRTVWRFEVDVPELPEPFAITERIAGSPPSRYDCGDDVIARRHVLDLDPAEGHRLGPAVLGLLRSGVDVRVAGRILSFEFPDSDVDERFGEWIDRLAEAVRELAG